MSDEARKLMATVRPEFLRSQLVGDEVVFTTLTSKGWNEALTITKIEADEIIKERLKR